MVYNDRSDIKNKNFKNLSTEDKLRHLVLLATLAPSSHNTQPWLFKILSDSIIVRANLNRSLSYSDPGNRELYISLGAAIETLHISAESQGLDFTEEYNPDSSDVYKITFQNLESNKVNQSVIDAIIDRHTNRLPFENREITLEAQEEFRDKTDWGVELSIVSTKHEKEEITNIVCASVEEAFGDKKFTFELSHWIKPSLSKYRDGMPGYTLLVPWLVSLFLPIMIRKFDLRKMQSKMHREWLGHAPSYAVLSTEQDNKSAWLAVGRVFQRIALDAQRLGIRIGIMGAPIEIGTHYRDLAKVIAVTGRPQMFFRLGYAKPMKHNSPRLDLSNVITNG